MRTQVYDQVHSGQLKHLLDACRHQALKVAKGFLGRLDEWRRRIRGRNELMRLSDRDLRDFQWTRANVQAEARKPFWRA
jgi:uncharacterized protein YjiS (DUF1127 family)